MIALQFLFSAAVIVAAATRLAKYGDVIAVRTRLGGLFIGTLLLSMATSLPELLTTLNAINQEVPDLAAGSIFGSSMFNMVMLAVLDLTHRKARLMRSVAVSHTLTASLAILLTGLAVFFIMADFEVQIGWVGLDSLVLIGMYFSAVQLIRISNLTGPPAVEPTAAELAALPGLRHAVIGFSVAGLALVLINPLLVSSAVGIAEATGLSTGFVGTALVAVVTSLPELAATVAAGRVGAFDLAVGNLFGSNIFNIVALALADFFYLQGRFMAEISPHLALAGVTGLVLTTLGLIGVLARMERRVLLLEINGLLILGYFIGMWLLFN